MEDLPAALAALKAAGVRLIDETPRPGARGHDVAFLHPAATGGVLFELLRGVRRVIRRFKRSSPAGAGQRRPGSRCWPARPPRRWALGAPGGRWHAAAARSNSEKEEGPAEEAPEENRPADLEPLSGYADQNKKKMQIFELNGYLRLRDDYMHDFFLGLGYSQRAERVDRPGTTNYGLPPFPVPLDCPSPANALAATIGMPGMPGTPAANCGTKNMGGANLRFRLEPTLNVTDQVRIHAQIDVLDNTILGSTPDSLAGIQGFNTPPATSMNGCRSRRRRCRASPRRDSCRRRRIRPKSARTASPPASGPSVPGPRSTPSSVRSTSAGCPGTGGAASSTTTAAAPTATSARRSIGSWRMTTVYGHQLKFAWDLGAQGDTTQQLSLGRLDPSGYPYDLSQNDDVLELMASVARIENPVDLRERIDRGDVVVNYGLQLVYRNQGNIDAVPATNAATQARWGSGRSR